jgi:hypothetical protein
MASATANWRSVADSQHLIKGCFRVISLAFFSVGTIEIIGLPRGVSPSQLSVSPLRVLHLSVYN